MKKNQDFLQTKDVTRATTLSRETLRFYESMGLISPLKRTDSGYRIYAPEVLAKIHFIKAAQEGGFSLKEIENIFALNSKSRIGKKELVEVAHAKIRSIDEKIKSLKSIKKTLSSYLNDPDAWEKTICASLFKESI